MNIPNVQIAAIRRCTIRLKKKPKGEIGDDMLTMWEKITMVMQSGEQHLETGRCNGRCTVNWNDEAREPTVTLI